MPGVTGLLPYDVANLLAGAARVLIGDTAAPPAVPTKINDIISIKSSGTYAPATGWIDVGATADASAYTRDLAIQEYTIEQSTGPVLEDVTETNRSIRVQLAEMKPEHLVIIEQAPAIATIAAVAGTNTAQKAVKFGTVTTLTSRRVAFVGQRASQSGVVNEGAGVTRGRFVVVVLYNCLISADAAEVSVGKGNLVSVPVTFRAYPESGQASGQEYGTWFDEQAGTI